MSVAHPRDVEIFSNNFWGLVQFLILLMLENNQLYDCMDNSYIDNAHLIQQGQDEIG